MAVVLDLEWLMTLGLAERQGNLLDDVNWFCVGALAESSVYAMLHRERDRLFPDDMFSDLFSDRGRRSVPPSVVATVMVLQRLEGLSDREAAERYTFDTRWRYAAGVGGYDGDGWTSFAHTVLVDMRARLAVSDRPRRIFEVTLETAGEAGLVGVKRVLDSTPLYDAVATMDTITLIRSAMRGLLKAADTKLEAELRAVVGSGDDYVSSAKPQIDWDDTDARETLIDSRARDAYAALMILDGRHLGVEVSDAAELLATVVGQDLEEDNNGTFRIARRVARDRVISTVDPEARHGHKTNHRRFDGYKGHVAIDPDTEIITDTAVTAGNVGDASVATDLIGDLVDGGEATSEETTDEGTIIEETIIEEEPVGARVEGETGETGETDRPTVYGDAAYGSGEFLDHLAGNHIDSRCKTQPPAALAGRFPKDRFCIDLEADTVTCPRGVTVSIRRNSDGDGIAFFADHCTSCALRAECTNAKNGRTIRVGRYEHRLAQARHQSQDPGWIADYRATRPKVERKLGHMMRRRHGGRRARVRGKPKVDADFNLLAAATNLARLATLGLVSTPDRGWAVAT